MTTPLYKQPELIPASLTMNAYNHRLECFELLYSPMQIAGEFDSHILSQFQNNQIHVISGNPSSDPNNYYKDKADYYHLQVDNCPTFIEPNVAENIKAYKNNYIRFKNKVVVSEFTSLFFDLDLDITSLDPKKYNFINCITTGNTLNVEVNSSFPAPNGIIWYVNTGTQSFTLKLNNTPSNNIVMTPGDKQKIYLNSSNEWQFIS
jgi:hypothetical protein